MAYFESPHILGVYGNPPQYVEPYQWCSIDATINESTQKVDYTLKVYSSSSDRFNLWNLSASIGGQSVYSNSYVGYGDYTPTWTVKTDSIDISLVSINNGYIDCSFTIGVGSTWRTTTASGSIPAIIPTVSTPTYTIRSGGYNSTIVADRSTIRISISGSTSSGTITKYLVNEGTTQLYNGTNSYYDLIPTSGQHKYKVKVMNSYGVWSEFSSEITITAQVYTPAIINSTTSQRWSSGSSSGHAQDDGTYARLSLTFTPAKIGTTNLTTTWKAQVSSFTSSNQTTSGAAVFSGSILSDSTYQVKYSIWDAYISTPIERTDIISMAGRGALDLYFDNGVHGIGFGTAGEAGKANFKFTPYFEFGNGSMISLIDFVYPVGSFYMTSVSPATFDPNNVFIGTTWTRITDRFIYAATDSGTYAVGQTGGSKTSVAKHTHPDASFNARGFYMPGDIYNLVEANTNTTRSATGPTWNNTATYSNVAGRTDILTIKTAETGIDDGNMPPWLAVYMWQRTA